jgi:hypothetical protein
MRTICLALFAICVAAAAVAVRGDYAAAINCNARNR